MVARAAQLGAEQGDKGVPFDKPGRARLAKDQLTSSGEERKGGVRDSTATVSRAQQRSNAPKSTDSVTSSASEQDSAVRGSVNNYEIAVLYHPDLEIDLDKASSKVEKIIAGSSGKITNTDNWGKRKLAYPINKQDFAVYVFYTVEIPAENVQKVEQTFNITDEIIRFLIIRPDLKKLAKAEALKIVKAKKAAERGEDEEAGDEEKSEE